MPIPWLAALRVIPWGTLLAGTPAIVRAADTLLSGAKARHAQLPSADEIRSLAERVAALEQHDQADAEVLKQVTNQVAALTTATEVLAARLRWLLVIGVAALSLALLAVALAWRR